jgi:hypothetical protein
MKTLHTGQVLKVHGGKYHGHACEVRKLHSDKGYAEVKINGKIVKLGFNRLTGGESGKD